MTDFAALMGIVYSMVKQDYVMQVINFWYTFFHILLWSNAPKSLASWCWTFWSFCNSTIDNFTTLLQERIVTTLNLKSLSGELESYCLMWSLRPFINDEIVHQAWRLIPWQLHMVLYSVKYPKWVYWVKILFRKRLSLLIECIFHWRHFLHPYFDLF